MTVTSNPTQHEASLAEQRDTARMVRTVVVSTAAALVIAFVVIAGALLATDAEVATAVWVGAFAAFWGGGGFGVMAGIALHNLRLERAAVRT